MRGGYRWSVGRDEGRVEGGEEKEWISTCVIHKYVLCTTLVYNYTRILLHTCWLMQLVYYHVMAYYTHQSYMNH